MPTEIPVSSTAVLAREAESSLSPVEQLKTDILGRFTEISEKDAIKDAIDFATQEHGTQTRNTEEPFMVHPLRAMKFALDNLETLFPSTYLAKLLQVIALHDVTEDTPTTREDIEMRFGWEVAMAVDLLSKKRNKVWKEEYRPTDNGAQNNKPFLENLHKLSESTNGSIPPLVIMMVHEAKACDRWENLHTLGTLVRDDVSEEEKIRRQRDYLEEAKMLILPLLDPSHPLYVALKEEIAEQEKRLIV